MQSLLFVAEKEKEEHVFLFFAHTTTKTERKISQD
jgi:hypothetical protein